MTVSRSNDLDVSTLRVELNDVDLSKVQGIPFPSKDAMLARGKIRRNSELHILKILQVALVPLHNLEPLLLSIRQTSIVRDVSEAISRMRSLHSPSHS